MGINICLKCQLCYVGFFLITIRNGVSCRCKNNRCVNSTEVCNLIDDCGDQSDELVDSSCVEYIGCNFEDETFDPCNFTQDKSGDNFDWTRNAGWTPSYNTGPTRDHTYGTSVGTSKQCERCCIIIIS